MIMSRKEQLMTILSETYPVETEICLVDVGQELHARGMNAAYFGHKKLREALGELAPVVSLRDEVLPSGGTQTYMRLHAIEDKAPSSMPHAGALPFAINYKAYESLCELYGYDRNAIHKLVYRSYDSAKAAGNISVRPELRNGSGDDIWVFTLAEPLADGREVQVRVGRPAPDAERRLYNVWAPSALKLLSMYGSLPNDEKLQELADLAVAEYWGPNGNPHRYLLEYLKATFVRAKAQGLILEEGSVSGFNTRLLDRKTGKDICALFMRSASTNSRRFLGFAVKGATGLAARYASLVSRLEPPTYFARVEDMVLGLPTSFGYGRDHILIDNVDRLPAELLLATRGAGGAVWGELMERLEKSPTTWRSELRDDLRKALSSSDGSAALVMMDALMTAAINDLVGELAGNPSLALPLFNPGHNETCFLVPLSVCSKDDRANLYLLVEKQQDGRCYGRTTLTLDMAYSNHRNVLRRVRENWLTALLHERNEARLLEENARLRALLDDSRGAAARPDDTTAAPADSARKAPAPMRDSGVLSLFGRCFGRKSA